MEILQDESLVMEIEAKAVEMAGQAGRVLMEQFGKSVEVEYKDKEHQDPVTSADKESQAYLVQAISQQFPDHGIVGEEDSEGAETPASDFLWVLDPLDGTTNFIGGLPIYAVSIGVLHRGMPLAAALFIPWPGEKGGTVLHARSGGGAFLDGEPLSTPQSNGPEANRLTGLPASFGSRFRPRKGLRRRVGSVRVTGSIAYELALTACGTFQYVIIGGPKIWDVAAGVLIVTEAGGRVLGWDRTSRRWEPVTRLGPSWESGPPSLNEIRNWTSPLIAGSSQVAPFVAANLQGRRTPLSARFRRLVRKLQRRGG